MSAEFCETMQASAAEHEAQLRSLHQERREAEEDAVRHHAAAVHSMQQAHKLEQVPVMPPISNLWDLLSQGRTMSGKVASAYVTGLEAIFAGRHGNETT